MTAEEPRYSPPRPPMPQRRDAADLPPAPPPRRGGCLYVLGGVILVAAGIPMLVLPGPGLFSIIGGLWMIGRGLGIVKPKQ